MKKFLASILIILFGIFSITAPCYAAKKPKPPKEATYPADLDKEELEDDEFPWDLDIEEQYREMPVPDFKYTEISSTLPSSCANEEIDIALLKNAPNIVKIAAIVVIITRLTMACLFA